MKNENEPVVSPLFFIVVTLLTGILALFVLDYAMNELAGSINEKNAKKEIPLLEKNISIGLGDSLYSDNFTLTSVNTESLNFERKGGFQLSTYTVPAKENTTFTLPINETRYAFHIVEIRKERNEVRLRVTKETTIK